MDIKKISILFLFVFITFNNTYSQIQQNRTMFFDGNNREYIIYVPSIYDGSEAYPLMFSFHGGGGTSTAAIMVGGYTGTALSAATEEFTGETSATTAKTVDFD